jgi:4-hydroxybenzoyl-CoA thioesterase
MSVFLREISVRFAYCDPAARVFHARYFEMINSLVEDWFEDGLEASFPGLLYHRGIVTPTVHFTVDFPAASRFGDRMTYLLRVVKIGTSSCELEIEASCQGELRMRAKQILVFLDQKTQRATEIPVDIAKRMRHYLKEPAAATG